MYLLLLFPTPTVGGQDPDNIAHVSIPTCSLLRMASLITNQHCFVACRISTSFVSKGIRLVFKTKEDLKKKMIDDLKGSLGTSFADPTALSQIWVQLLAVLVGLAVCNMPLKSQDPVPLNRPPCHPARMPAISQHSPTPGVVEEEIFVFSWSTNWDPGTGLL